ncbi:MAG TPA: hypothetical protein VKU19_39395 [Bryobacteraceae bacterium]|nr:hypothetical protein [Bryobacteraceae bacterium]
MTQPDHLTEEQFARYRSRALAPVELLEVDEHIGHCEICRERLYRQAGAGPHVRQLRAELSGHLEYDQIASCAHGSFPPDVARHLEDCDMCRSEVEDLRQFRAELESVPRAPIQMPARRTPWRMAVAAAVLLAASLTVWYVKRGPTGQPGLAVTPKPSLPAEPPLDDAEKAALQLALDTHKLERAPILDRLIAKPGVLLGPSTETPGFALQRPMGTAVVSDRPTVEWKAAPNATHYVVSIFDENFEKVAESPALTGTEWQVEHPLARGRLYNWQVTAQIGSKSVHAPTPPAPEARFQVVSQETADEIESARREHPSNHLLLAALYAKAGAVEEAAKEVDQLAITDPASAATLRQSLK